MVVTAGIQVAVPTTVFSFYLYRALQGGSYVLVISRLCEAKPHTVLSTE